MGLDKHHVKSVYTIFIFVALASLDNAVIGLFPPLFSSIARDLGIGISKLGIVSAINIFITALSSIFWGYLADRGNRKRLIIIGTIIWSISVFLTAYSHNYLQLAVCQFFTGIGLGCIGSIGFSVLTDYIPKKWRGMLMSLWGLSQGFGGIAGSVMASIVATAANWRKPFEIIAILGFGFTFLYFFIKEPKKGASEPELKKLVGSGYEYNYIIELDQLHSIIMKRSNIWLILQGFFMNITTGTLIWLPTLYISKIASQGYSSDTSIIAAGYLFAILQIGGLSSIYFGYLGDMFQKHTYRGRATLAGFSVLTAMPLYMLMFIVPMRHLILPDSSNPIYVFFGLLHQLLLNPWMTLMLVLAIAATAAQSANTPNWLALITDVNLPEHRATAFSIANLVNGIGRSIGNAFFGIVLGIISKSVHKPDNFILTLIFFQLAFLPSALCYVKIARNTGRDIRKVKSILKKRSRIT